MPGTMLSTKGDGQQVLASKSRSQKARGSLQGSGKNCQLMLQTPVKPTVKSQGKVKTILKEKQGWLCRSQAGMDRMLNVLQKEEKPQNVRCNR